MKKGVFRENFNEALFWWVAALSTIFVISGLIDTLGLDLKALLGIN